MTGGFRPPALQLPDARDLRWTSLTKVLREPEDNWPAQICEEPIYVGRVGRRSLALVSDPEAVREILTSPEARFVKWRIYSRMVSVGAGRHNISAAEGADCQRQRRAMTPLLRADAAPALAPLFRSAVERALSVGGAEDGPRRIDASLEATRIALDAIWRVLFSIPPDAPLDGCVDDTARAYHSARMAGRVNDAAGALAELALPVFDDADEKQIHANPFLALGNPTASCRLSAEELHDNARLLLNAGHETTAQTLAWALWLTGRDPDTQARVHAEIDVVTDGAPIGAEHLERLVFTRRVINETLRLFPAVPIAVREARQEETFCGVQLPAGALWVPCLYAMHRHVSQWDDASAFRPDRFAEGSAQPRNRYAFLPFGAGRHVCIGATVGWTEALTVFASVLQGFEVEADPTCEPGLRMAPTLGPDRPMPLILKSRRT